MNAMIPKVSIGLPVRNGEDTLRIAIDSLLAQDYQDFELIISDNASTDETSKICLDYARRDSRVQFRRNDTNVGAAENFNGVFRSSRGKYFMWAAHDDRWHSSYVGRCLAGLEQNRDVVLCFTGIRFIDTLGRPLDDTTVRNIIGDYNRMHTRSMGLVQRVKELSSSLNWYAAYGLIRVGALRQTALYRDGYGGDVMLLMDLLFQGETLVLPEALFDYRLVQKTAETHHEVITGSPHTAGKLQPYTQLATSLLDVIDRSRFSSSIKSDLREDLIENVSFSNQPWARKIHAENESRFHPGDRFLVSVQIRDLLARAPSRAISELRDMAFQKFLLGLSAPDRMRHRAQRMLDRHLLWRLRPKRSN